MGVAASYLASTRRERPAFLMRDHYTGIFDALHRQLAPLGSPPEFDVTYSSERTCETIRLNGRTIVIYDQYLGQTLNQMNRIHANSEDPFEALVYGYKIAAEFAQIDGQDGLAALLRTAFEMHKARTATYRSDRDVGRRTRIGGIQEKYVIAHEAFHSILEQQPSWRNEMLADARGDFLTNYYSPLIFKMAEDDPAELDRVAPALIEQMQQFERDDALVEECICDTLALTLLVPHPDLPRTTQQMEEIRSAIYFALRHLTVLSVVRQTVRTFRRDGSGRSASATPYLVRVQFLEWTLRKFRLFSEVWTDASAEARFAADIERYATYLEDPLLVDLPDTMRRLTTEAVDGVLLVDRFEGEDPWDQTSADRHIAEQMAALGESFFVTRADEIDDTKYMQFWASVQQKLGPLAPKPPPPRRAGQTASGGRRRRGVKRKSR